MSFEPGDAPMIVIKMAPKLAVRIAPSKHLMTSLRIKKAITTVMKGESWLTTAMIADGTYSATE